MVAVWDVDRFQVRSAVLGRGHERFYGGGDLGVPRLARRGTKGRVPACVTARAGRSRLQVSTQLGSGAGIGEEAARQRRRAGALSRR